MKAAVAMILWLALSAVTGIAATKEPQSPDRDSLRRLEFLRQIELIQQMEMLRDMDHLENAGEPKTVAPEKSVPEKKKETVK
jgi:hypothetical protein